MSASKNALVLPLVFALLSACTVYTPAPYEPMRPMGEGEVVYEPMYYDQVPVYYRDDGVPIYYIGETVYVVPRSHPRYGALVRHCRGNVRGYQNWHRSHPHRAGAKPRRR